MNDELDLEVGDPRAGEPETPAQRRRRERRERGNSGDSGGSSSSSSSKGSTERSDSSLASGLDDSLTSLSNALADRGDEELSTAIREESKKMSEGLVRVTRRVPFLRGPLVFVLAVLDPILAFHRVGRILFVRWVERRQRAAWAAQQEAEQQPVDGSVM